MIGDQFRVLLVDLESRSGSIELVGERHTVLGGSGLAALLFRKYGLPDAPWNHPGQPLIFAVGPLTGYYPLMSKTVLAFKSPYHDQYAESHAGGRSALCLRFAGLDALVITGRAKRPCCLGVGSRRLDIKDTHYLWGMDVQAGGKMLRNIFTKGSGHRSILRIGPAGEIGSPMAGINVDTYRHFGRLGGGAAMGVKNLKGIVIEGDAVFPLPGGKDYARLFEEVHHQLTATDMMKKYHDLGTPVNMGALNKLKALPIRNLKQTTSPDIESITGERFAADTLLRNMACAGCPVGCIHVGFVREKFAADHRFVYRQVSYDHEPIFAVGSMLGVTNPFGVLDIIDAVEKMGLDVMSAGVALAWATEATENGLISAAETVVPLTFGDASRYREAVGHLGRGGNDFYRLLARGTAKAAAEYGGGDFACVLGQEMAGYATGETFFTSQALGFRHSHLDAGGYAFDQAHGGGDADAAVAFLLADERERVLLTSMVACLFARGVYSRQLLGECLQALGCDGLADNLETAAGAIQESRWQLRLATGFQPEAVRIPKRFYEVRNWKGPIDRDFLDVLRGRYAQAIRRLGSAGPQE
jgi:aldehyde:ferredoxin oxidoreductase